MTGTTLLSRLTDAGLSVSRNGDQLIVVPRDRITEELRYLIRTGKRALLESLPPRSLDDRIRAMALRWGYSQEELGEELAFSIDQPEASMRWVERDERQWPTGTFIQMREAV